MRREKLLFYLVLDKYIDNMFLVKIIEKLDTDIPQDQRQKLQDRVDSIELDLEQNEFLLLGLFYSLHTQVAKEGYMSMFTRELIDKSHLKFDVRSIEETNELLKNTMDSLGIELEYGNENPRYVKNIEFYIDDFQRKYPNASDQ